MDFKLVIEKLLNAFREEKETVKSFLDAKTNENLIPSEAGIQSIKKLDSVSSTE